MQQFTLEGEQMRTRRGWAVGALTGSRPLESATWRGLMVGAPTAGARRGERLQGDATLTYSFGSQRLNAAFTDIKNIDSPSAHSVSSVRFSGVPVDTRGQFQADLKGNRIQGGFYGPGHAEAAGVFEKSNIVGAFGARK